MSENKREEVLIKALNSIVNPLLALEQEAKKDGNKLDGFMAVQLANDPEHLKQIARQALLDIRLETDI